MDSQRTFDTYMVASTITGIAMGSMSYSDFQRIASILFGDDIWTHELGHKPTMDAVTQEGYRQFPLMPTEAQAAESWENARNIAEKAYGHFVVIKKGTHGRKESIVDTAKAMNPNIDVLGISVEGDE